MAKAELFEGQVILVMSEEEASDLFCISNSCVGSNCLPFIYQDKVFQNLAKKYPNPFTWSGEAAYRKVS